MDTHSQETAVKEAGHEEEKPWQFKKQGNNMFKVFKRGTNELLEGFEQEEWNSPLVGNRYITALIKAAESKATVDAPVKAPAVTLGTSSAASAGMVSDTSTHTGTESAQTTTAVKEEKSGFEIPIIGGIPDIQVTGSTQYWEVTVQEQSNDAKRKDIMATDGRSREFTILLGAKCILPIGVLNVLRESIYTFLTSHYDQAAGMAWVEPRDESRFTIQVHRQVPEDEAVKWLNERKRIYFQRA
jgi:hypothetical protein